MVNKLIVIGIDGMDFDVVRRHRDILPNITGMMEEWGCPRLRSVFPADTTPAWTTIFTGLDPSEHGIINFVNMGDRENRYRPISFDDSALRGRTFWDRLCEDGERVGVLFPMNVKEGWDPGGIMITRPYENAVRVHPASLRDKYSPSERILCTDPKFTSEKKLDALFEDFLKKSEEEFRITKEVLEGEELDVLFTYFSAVDGVQHDFWRHYDKTHPEYPGENLHSAKIPQIYALLDSYVGRIADMCPTTPVLVISDHGHGARPVYIARVNEMLRRGGYLFTRGGDSAAKKKKGGFKNLLKRFALGFVKKFGLPRPMIKLAKKLPFWKGLFASSADFDWDKTTAYLSDLSALKNYSYGGIRLKDDKEIGEEERDRLASEIAEYLRGYRLKDGSDAFLWVKPVKELYSGEYLSRYPEIIFQLDERYGADWNPGEEIFEEKGGFMHSLSPGAHRYETAVIASRGVPLTKEQYEMTDIYGIIMNNAKKSHP